jgi:hypothetical protein
MNPETYNTKMEQEAHTCMFPTCAPCMIEIWMYSDGNCILIGLTLSMTDLIECVRSDLATEQQGIPMYILLARFVSLDVNIREPTNYLINIYLYMDFCVSELYTLCAIELYT